MSIQENKEFMARYMDAINGKDKTPALIDQFVADSDQALKDHVAVVEAAFPRYELNVEELLFDGNKAVARFNLHGTHKGDFMGIPATGKEINVPGIIIYCIADGKVAEHWLHFDAGLMMQQLGVQPEEVPA